MGLTGGLPTCLLSEGSALQHLSLGGNALSGALPEADPQLHLTTLRIPEVCTVHCQHCCGRLRKSVVGICLPGARRKMRGPAECRAVPAAAQNGLEGPLPASIATLPMLRRLNANGNNLSGELPESWSRSLRFVNLSSNAFQGR